MNWARFKIGVTRGDADARGGIWRTLDPALQTLGRGQAMKWVRIGFRTTEFGPGAGNELGTL
eukprot:9249308-Prorocentrum_lima.AAC.1